MSDFGEPWQLLPSGSLGSVYCADGNGDFVAGRSSDEGYISEDDPRWQRIVACVNFCRNLPQPWLEHHVATQHLRREPRAGKIDYYLEVEENL